MNFILLLTISILVRIGDCGFTDSDGDLNFEFEDEEPTVKQSPAGAKEQALQETLLRAMKKPSMREQIGEVIPILRVMSPQQRLTLAALVSAQIMAPQHADQQNLAEVATMFGGPGQNPKNVSEQLLLPISMDIAKMFRGVGGDAGRSWRSAPPPWERSPMMSSKTMVPVTVPPTAQSFNITVIKGTPWKSEMPSKGFNEFKRRNDYEVVDERTDTKDCETVASNICEDVANYPEAQILGSIQKQLSLMESFLTEYGDVRKESEGHKLQRRQDIGNDLGSGEGYMCPSNVKYAKPKRARTTSGIWKFVVNTGEYTQTLRLEMCLKNGASCSYLNDNFRSVCNQVYNYHRLMTWDEKRGLHMDVFKVPSCCSCHVQGYTSRYPPEYTFAEKRKEVVPIPQSNSGVKREIPRPGRPGVNPHFQNIHNFNLPKKTEKPQNEFSRDQTVSTDPHHTPFFPQHTNKQNQMTQISPGDRNVIPLHSNFIQNQRIPQQQQILNQNIQTVNPPKVNQQLPQSPGGNFYYNPQRPYIPQNFHLQSNNQPHIPLQRQPDRPNFQNVNIDVQGSGSIQNVQTVPALVDHLVPPGPPLPLDNERRPSYYDIRRRNSTLTRYPEANKPADQIIFNSHGSTNNMPGSVQTPVRINRPTIRPIEPVKPANNLVVDNIRTTQKPIDQMFGTKLRGKKPIRSRPVFVTPQPDENKIDFDNSVKVTPKPSNKLNPNKKKINYNYHPIIDFFSRDAHNIDRQFHVETPTQTPKTHQPRVQSNHEWTPMI